MSEPKLISPLLDGFAMGAPMSDHNGVRCCPALKDNTDKKYIVKIISIPASQVQLDALLLTGAYKEPSAALDYFKELADAVEKEAQCLQKLAKLEGFLPYEDWQVVPMDIDRLGYEVYLLGSYKRSLEKYMQRNTMTQLEAVNLGLDMCTALSAARRAGWIYADLKPSNIFLSEGKDYRIGDLGFMELDNLKYTSLPEKYRSAYTPPELEDDLNSPNLTMDTYALGKILYQIFNNGVLETVDYPTEDPLPPPQNADYELAEIIMKAISPNPRERWEDPAEMGNALVGYMQRNAIGETPILPPVAEVAQEAPETVKSRRDETLPGMNNDTDLSQENLSEEMAQMMAQADDLISHEPPAPPVAPEAPSVEQLEEEVLRAAEEEKKAAAQETAEQEAAVQLFSEAEPAAQAAEQAAAVAVQEKKKSKKKQKKQDNYTDLGIKRRKGRLKKFLVTLLVLAILAGLGYGGYWFYQNEYLMMVDSLSVEGSENQLTVILDGDFDENALTVVCTDTYGNTKLSPVADGRAEFADLLPDMLYKIRVEVEGFHRLDGSITHEIMTPAETKIASFTAATGPEDGSVILNFTVTGPDSDEWTVICSADGQEPMRQSFTGHMVTVTGLTVGKPYTFSLEPTAELYITGGNTLEFTASSIVIAENLQIEADGLGHLSVSWSVPEGAVVESWDVHCYSSDGYDQRLTTTELTATFDEIANGSAYTVEVTASGMTQPARTGITANPIHITGVSVNADDISKLVVSWDYEGNTPEGGWLLLYTIDGGERQQVVQCESNSGTIEVRVPAATYDFTIQAADGSTVFDGTASFRTANADVYENPDQAFYPQHQAQYFFVNLLKTPAAESWTHANVSRNDYTTTFRSGDGISVLLYYMQDFYIRHENISVMYVIRDAEGKVISDLIGMENLDWRDDMWCGPNYHYCGLDIPLLPTEPGEYSLGLYFNGYAVTAVNFTITE